MSCLNFLIKTLTPHTLSPLTSSPHPYPLVSLSPDQPNVCEGRSELVVVQDLIGVCHIQTGEPKGMWSYHGNFRERIRKTDKLTDKLEVFCWDRHITIWTAVLRSETHDGLGGVYDMNVCELVSDSR